MNQQRPILLVEDNVRDVELTLAALKQNNVVNEVVVARHGGEALDYLYRRGAHQKRPAIMPLFILLDLKMPKVDGLEVLQKLKNDDELKVIPVVMLTSSREEADLVKSYRLGVNAYIVKPVGFQEFATAIHLTGLFWLLVNELPPHAPSPMSSAGQTN
jgi:CheY-like chemotaxis protein